MSENPNQIINNQYKNQNLKCQICCLSFNFNEKAPRILNCGHHFCQQCIQKGVYQTKFKCFSCQSTNQIENMEELPKPFLILLLLDQKHDLPSQNNDQEKEKQNTYQKRAHQNFKKFEKHIQQIHEENEEDEEQENKIYGQYEDDASCGIDLSLAGDGDDLSSMGFNDEDFFNQDDDEEENHAGQKNKFNKNLLNPTNYKKVVEGQQKSQEYEIRVKAGQPSSNYINRAATLLLRDQVQVQQGQMIQPALDTIVIKASGAAIEISLKVADIVRRKIRGLHQINRIYNQTIIENYLPMKVHLEPVQKKKDLAIFEIVLTRYPTYELMSEVGYQGIEYEYELNQEQASLHEILNKPKKANNIRKPENTRRTVDRRHDNNHNYNRNNNRNPENTRRTVDRRHDNNHNNNNNDDRRRIDERRQHNNVRGGEERIRRRKDQNEEDIKRGGQLKRGGDRRQRGQERRRD